MRDDADQASVAVLSMMPVMVTALNLIGRPRAFPDPAMLMIAVSAASRAPSRCPHPSARARIRDHATLNLALQSSRSTPDPLSPPGLP